MNEKRRCPQCDGQGMIPVTVEALSKCPTCGGSGFLPMTIEQRRALSQDQPDQPDAVGAWISAGGSEFEAGVEKYISTLETETATLRTALAQTLRELDEERGRRTGPGLMNDPLFNLPLSRDTTGSERTTDMPRPFDIRGDKVWREKDK